MSDRATPEAAQARTVRPLVTLKAAVTLDGRIATRTGDSKWITGETARREAHLMRARAGAVMVGVGTVLADDPRLTLHMLAGSPEIVRGAASGVSGAGTAPDHPARDRARDPVRIVVDTHLRIPAAAKLVAHASSAPTWIAHGPAASAEARGALVRPGVELLELPLIGERLDLAALLAELGRRGLGEVLVEGGSTLFGALLDAGLADRMAIFVAPMVLGDRAARTLADRARPAHLIADATRLFDVRTRALGDDVLIEGRIRSEGPRSEGQR